MQTEPERRPAEEAASPGISVIVITLNEATRIAACLDSLLAVDYPADRREIIVVDASTDETPEIVRRYPEVRLLRSERGFARQKNIGLEAALYEIVAFTDADCIVFPDWLRRIEEAFATPATTGVGGNAYAPPGVSFFGLCVAAIGHPAGGAIGFDANVTPGPEGIEFAAGCDCAFRTEALRSTGGFSSAFDMGGEDVDASRRVRAGGGRLEYAPGMSVYHDPRQSFREYVKWNVRVGVSKYDLGRPVFVRLVLEPSFPLWSVVIAGGLLWLGRTQGWTTFIGALAFGWLAFLLFLYVGARPFPLLIRRRRRIGLPLWAVLTVVPFLIYVRQVAINVGALGEWYRHRRDSSR